MRYFRRSALVLAATAYLWLRPGVPDPLLAWTVRVLAVVAGAALLTRWVVGPWKEFNTAARRVHGGDFQARLDDISRGDLAEASGAFNAMAEALQAQLRLSREREERLTAVLAASDRAVLVLGRDGGVQVVNPATFSLFPRFTESGGIASLALPGLAQILDEAQQSGIAQRKSLDEGERGAGRTFSAQVTPLGKEGTVIYLRDVTQESRLDRVKTELVANVSHELRTPLTALTQMVDLLSDDDLPVDRRRHFLARLDGQVARMRALVEDLLSLSRLEAAETRAELADVSLAASLEDIRLAFSPLAESSGVALALSVPKDLTVTTDAGLLDAAVRNLVDNAIRYNRPGGTVSMEASEDGGAAVISVRDTGDGIPRQHLPRIFERFYRADPHRSREKGGTGLGLSIVKHAVEKLGGEISVKSTVGQGTTFTIRLPQGEQGKA